MGVNQFADLSREEFGALLRKINGKGPRFNATKRVSLPTVSEEMDWRERGAVTYVKNQGQCGSCWTFSVTGTIEGQNYIRNNISIPLSEQQLVDCNTEVNLGCDGGDVRVAFKYVTAHGLLSEDEYPYEAKNGKCRANNRNPTAKITGYKEAEKGEDNLKEVVGNVGPASVAMMADLIQFYSEGIYDDENGYIRIKRGKNKCGIANQIVYPIL